MGASKFGMLSYFYIRNKNGSSLDGRRSLVIAFRVIPTKNSLDVCLTGTFLLRLLRIIGQGEQS